MSEPIKEPESWQFIEFLEQRVRLIAKDAGFYTDLGAGIVATDDGMIPAEHSGPAVTIASDRISTGSTGKAQANSTVEVTIEFSVPRGGDEANPRRLVHRARKDLMRVLVLDTRSMPFGFGSIELGETVMADAADDAGHSSVIAQITVRAGLTETFIPVPDTTP